ncbi:hypothetical protein NDU88_002817 [Pleurodeles waltl]|uniref:Uncharacterized protein n=1 Tax=Pleurodeles waltl TaxID=8319 RepID=A0AAV7VBM4_PLEWA|nr:hypothetical protein NDU88_002817 [Pleurodeles waltl]
MMEFINIIVMIYMMVYTGDHERKEIIRRCVSGREGSNPGHFTACGVLAGRGGAPSKRPMPGRHRARQKKGGTEAQRDGEMQRQEDEVRPGDSEPLFPEGELRYATVRRNSPEGNRSQETELQ